VVPIIQSPTDKVNNLYLQTDAGVTVAQQATSAGSQLISFPVYADTKSNIGMVPLAASSSSPSVVLWDVISQTAGLHSIVVGVTPTLTAGSNLTLSTFSSALSLTGTLEQAIMLPPTVHLLWWDIDHTLLQDIIIDISQVLNAKNPKPLLSVLARVPVPYLGSDFATTSLAWSPLGLVMKKGKTIALIDNCNGVGHLLSIVGPRYTDHCTCDSLATLAPSCSSDYANCAKTTCNGRGTCYRQDSDTNYCHCTGMYTGPTCTSRTGGFWVLVIGSIIVGLAGVGFLVYWVKFRKQDEYKPL